MIRILIVTSAALLLVSCSQQRHAEPTDDTEAPSRYTTDIPRSERDDEPVRLATPSEIKAYLERRWPVDRIDQFCLRQKPSDPDMQNLVCDGKFQYGSRLHDEVSHDLGVVYWYGHSYDGISWGYSVNVVKGGIGGGWRSAV